MNWCSRLTTRQRAQVIGRSLVRARPTLAHGVDKEASPEAAQTHVAFHALTIAARGVAVEDVLPYRDVVLTEDRLVDRLRAEPAAHFARANWAP